VAARGGSIRRQWIPCTRTGAKRILIPSENKRDLADVPDAILTAIQWQFYDSPTKAAIMAMGMG
jgi:ATP-dependent Lon protease